MLVEGLPIEQPDRSDHYGSAIAFCSGYLYLSVGDTDGPAPENTQDIRRFAQLPTRAEGKIRFPRGTLDSPFLSRFTYPAPRLMYK